MFNNLNHMWQSYSPDFDLYNLNPTPWTLPLLALLAGISEELIYRHFGETIFRQMFRKALLKPNPLVSALTWFIPNLIWALCHIFYPIHPNSVRIIELIFMGYAFTQIKKRYGILTAIMTHIYFDLICFCIGEVQMGYNMAWTPFTIKYACYFIIPTLVIIGYRKIKQRSRQYQTADIPLNP